MINQKKKKRKRSKEFIEDLKKFTFLLENEDIERFSLLEKYDINTEAYIKMCKEIKLYASYDEDKENIGFPYEQWVDRL